VPVGTGGRVLYPLAHFTKADVVAYYDAVASFLLPHLRDRPVTLKRYPDEVSGEFFYEKDAPAFTPEWVKTFPVWRRSGESQINYVVMDNERTLRWAASVGTVEIHPFLARVPRMDVPTSIVFDLDPGEGRDVLDSIEVAFLLRDLLERLGLKSFAKVSGSRGMHVCVPLNTPTEYAITQPFAQGVAELLRSDYPGKIVSEMQRVQRRGKVFIDWSQNADYKTTVGVYSLRAKRRRPYVSMPVDWGELLQIFRAQHRDALFFSPEAALKRLRTAGDLFAPVLTLKQRLPDPFVVGPEKPRGSRHARFQQMPHVSAQGGRRAFTLDDNDGSLELTIDLHRVLLRWRFPEGLPARGGASRSCTLLQTRSSSQPAGDLRQQARRAAQMLDRSTAAADAGTCELIEGNPAKGYLHLYFSGRLLAGSYVLQRVPESRDDWRITKGENDLETAVAPTAKRTPAEGSRGAAVQSPDRKNEILQKQNTTSSGRSQRILPSSLPERAPKFVPLMECRLVAAVPQRGNWLYEIKLDGYRAMAIKTQHATKLLSRHNHSLAARFPQIMAAVGALNVTQCALDGEIVALDPKGKPSFQQLQNARPRDPTVFFYVFDLLNYAGRELLELPLIDRKRLLERVAKSFVEPVRLAGVFQATAADVVAAVRQQGLEGVVAKRRDSRYEPGKRSGAWQKFRINERQEFWIGGYLPGNTGLDALLVGSWQSQKLIFIKKLRNGFVPQTRRMLLDALRDLRMDDCPFVNLPEPGSRRGAVDTEEMRKCVWVRPERKCEVEFVERTSGGRLRHAAFRSLIDKAAR
jgi:bifunctional non-homologous end joining protein LigD